MTGNAGNNILRGGAGDDVLIGRDGDDVLVGQGGADRLNGGAGVDRLIGRDGADIFEFASGFERGLVYGYEDGVDRFDVSAFAPASFAADILPGIKTVNGNAVIDFDIGTATPDRIVLIGQSAANLDATDFILS